MPDLIWREFNGKSIRHRADGFMSLTDMCQSHGKLFADWNRLKATKEYLKALQDKYSFDSDNPPIEVNVGNRSGGSNSSPIKVNQGGNPTEQGTWGDRRVAMRLAQWLSPEFALQVDEWVVELLETKADQCAFEKSFFEAVYNCNRKVLAAYVYALHDPKNRRVKIGLTTQPRQRLRQLQSGDSVTFSAFWGVRQLDSLEEARFHEKALHDMFTLDRISGEWFNDELMVDGRFEDYFLKGVEVQEPSSEVLAVAS